MKASQNIVAVLAAILLLSCQQGDSKTDTNEKSENCPIELVVLGVGQDAGAPQIGNPGDPAWVDPSKRLYATSLGLLDHENGKRYLFEATPDIRAQMQILDTLLPYDGEGPYIDGIFITHAHIGHYAGLMFLGRESMGAKGVPVYVMPRMKEYLETNGPWSQLVELGNIELHLIGPSFVQKPDGERQEVPFPKSISDGIAVGVLKVPHRDEFSETVMHSIINSKTKNVAIFLPDIDNWNSVGSNGKSVSTLSFLLDVPGINYAFLDATFYDDNELPGRDMSQIPHPRVTESMNLIESTGDESLKDKVRFIHINHTNPLRDKTSEQYKEMTARGFKLAYRGERFCL